SWTLFPTIDPYPNGNQLLAVSGTSGSDVWEVGAAFHKLGSRGYALHWNGSAWATYPETDPHGHGGQLSGVAAITPNDVWVVGAQYPTERYASPLAMIEHWNGSAFSEVTAPPVSGAATVLYGIASFGASDVWAAGGSQTASGPENSYLVHWDGTAWKLVSSPNVPNNSTNLVAVAGTSGNDVWAVGDYYGNPSSNYATLAEHWDGSTWSIVPTPNVSGHSGRLNAVVAIAPSDAWAVGEYVNGTKLAPLTEHWNGSKWSIVSAPDRKGGSVFLLGVTAIRSNDVWAVGEIGTSSGDVDSYTLHWDGKAWKVGNSANVHGKAITLLNAVTVVPGAGLWAVGGDANKQIVVDTVTERLTCSKEGGDLRR
ncbi:MAG: hypothetical protein JO060_01680, partial [Candidatus Eremiobacteraeota bacterium]|nr:hypothetical protein [Candidatus Eremiobacteraeota bacterium]